VRAFFVFLPQQAPLVFVAVAAHLNTQVRRAGAGADG
jgi:hypothetical protein